MSRWRQEVPGHVIGGLLLLAAAAGAALAWMLEQLDRK